MAKRATQQLVEQQYRRVREYLDNTIRFGRNSRWWYESKSKKGKTSNRGTKNLQHVSEEQRDFDFETERIEGDQGYISEDEHTEQADLTLGNMDCIPRFPNNVSSLLGDSIRNNDDNQNIVRSVNYFVPQSQIV